MHKWKFSHYLIIPMQTERRTFLEIYRFAELTQTTEDRWISVLVIMQDELHRVIYVLFMLCLDRRGRRRNVSWLSVPPVHSKINWWDYWGHRSKVEVTAASCERRKTLARVSRPQPLWPQLLKNSGVVFFCHKPTFGFEGELVNFWRSKFACNLTYTAQSSSSTHRSFFHSRLRSLPYGGT